MLLNKNYRESYIKTGSLSPIEQNTPASNIVLDDIIGQEIAKRALVIAVAGNHNIMLNGAPGAGKSMLAKAMPSIMPPLQQNEILEITHIHSLANKNFEKIIRERPFRSPHHTSSNTSIIGGGQKPKPGEISLSHHGVLLFDEFPEFSRSIIESLRQPLEDKVITVARAKDSIDFPANFLLVATSNPCPCGYFGSKKECTCTPTQILKYQRKTSGPIMDRIDLYIDVEEIDNSKLVASKNSTEYLKIRKNVEEARNIQYTRANKLNSELNNKELSKFANLEGPAQHILEIAGAQMNLSARAYLRSLKVARTIADLEKSEKILPKHITEALQYRKRSSEF